MHPDLVISLDRADELVKELLAEYDRSLHDKKVGTRAIQLTHEVFERLRGVLDRVARLYWEQKVAPQLSQDDRDAAACTFQSHSINTHWIRSWEDGVGNPCAISISQSTSSFVACSRS
jgi:hypothetical protein